MMRKASLVATLCAALMGCQATQSTSPVSRSSVGPGAQHVDGANAMVLFNDICVETSPRFSKTHSIIARLPFQQHPSTGTYYHRNLNLSVKLTSGASTSTCSMVFASKDDPAQLALIMGLAGQGGGASIELDPVSHMTSTTLSNGTRIRFKPTSSLAGQNYYSVAATAAN